MMARILWSLKRPKISDINVGLRLKIDIRYSNAKMFSEERIDK